MAAVPAKYPPPVPVRRTAGAQPTSPAKRTPQNFVIPLKPVLPHVTDCEVDEKLRLEESLYSAESLVREKPPLSDDNVQDYPREVYNIRQGRRQVEEIELLEEPMAQQGQQLLNASESSMSAESSDRGPSVFETTQMDADKFEAEIDEPFYDRKVGRDRGGKPWLARDFLLCLRIIVFVSCLLCLWPFSCICLCCAYGCRRRIIDRNYEGDYTSAKSTNVWVLACAATGILFMVIGPPTLVIALLSVIIASAQSGP